MVCKKGICRDYAVLLKKLEKGGKGEKGEKAPLSYGGNYRFQLKLVPRLHVQVTHRWTVVSPFGLLQGRPDLEATIDSTLAGEDVATRELEAGFQAKAGVPQGVLLPLAVLGGSRACFARST